MRALVLPSVSLLFAAVLVLALLPTGPTSATETIAAAEGGLECALCHDGEEAASLGDRGKYYEAVRTLEGFEELEERFQECTYCHVQEPGSLELTEKGRRYHWMMEDMEGIREWLMERHLDPERASPESDG